MKIFLALSAFFALTVAAFAAEEDVLRPGGDYAIVSASTPSGCEAACAIDGLCMSWTFTPESGECALKAVVPAPVRAKGMVSGIAPRAPAFARLAEAPPPMDDSPSPPPPAETALPPLLSRAEHLADDDELLGGPDEDLGLRAQLPDEL